jgi:hypothetical protein
MTKQEKIEDVLTRGVEEVIDRGHLEKRLKGKERTPSYLPHGCNEKTESTRGWWLLRSFQLMREDNFLSKSREE